MSDAITAEHTYQSRRAILRRAAQFGLLTSSLGLPGLAYSKKLKLTPEKYATNYNNYYEFSTNKEAVAILSKAFTMFPWTLSISGLVNQPQTLNFSDIPLGDEYIYRFRCVEGWSMVIPWIGIPLSYFLKQAKPKAEAKFVKFTTVFRPKEMIGQRRNTMAWPYTEALRLDEAMNPLTILATGMYQKQLPAQNGGPIRLVVPWKYGFKSIKAIQSIELVADQPTTTWNTLAPNEYGFYGNVNPDISHPRWSQRREVRLGELKKRRTLPFNGYENDVAHLYKDMDPSQLL